MTSQSLQLSGNKHNWRASLHGGHTGPYCDHAEGEPEAFVEAALAAGLGVFGFTEHAPRVEPRFLYAEEVALGWDVARLEAGFAAYAEHISSMGGRYADRITVLRGFETEVVPAARYVEVMSDYRKRFGFDYIVGSVHHVDDIIFDYTRDLFEQACAHCGGLEGLAVRYYETVAEMVCALRPEVVGHFDLIRKQVPDEESVSTPRVREAACRALDAVRDTGGILDVNTGGYRKGLGRPYPAPWAVREALARGIPFALGDDSHRPGEVGAHFDEARDYLLGLGVDSLTLLDKMDGRLVRRVAPLLDET
jgi:histidinol-phosphatase (PHP family)